MKNSNYTKRYAVGNHNNARFKLNSDFGDQDEEQQMMMPSGSGGVLNQVNV